MLDLGELRQKLLENQAREVIPSDERPQYATNHVFLH
ncbi:MAG: hypothetical protein CLLPBCKN_003744 [Chroococcidiopsis cubana SAG 39.79]|nr:hypothetical protein [Chroococcidiopsis cubana SAG 39.79]